MRLIALAMVMVTFIGSASATSTKSPSDRGLCIAAVAASNGYKASFLKKMTAEVVGDTIWVSYHRPSDGKFWRYPCQVRDEAIAIAFTPRTMPQFDGARRIVWTTELTDLVITETVMGSTNKTRYSLMDTPR